MSENKKKYVVRLSNKIAQMANDQMSVLARKLSYTVNIKAIENKSREVTLSLNEIIELLGLSKGGSSYIRLKKEICKAVGESIFTFPSHLETSGGIKETDAIMPIYDQIHEIKGEYTYVFILRNEYYESITADKNFNLNLYEIMVSLDSTYSLRLFEYVSSKRNEYSCYGKHPVVSLQQLYEKLIIGLTSFPEWKRFKEKILDPSVKEINKKTDLIIKYETIKEKRKVIAVRFYIIEKNKAKEAETNLTKSSEEELLTYHDSNGCKLNGYEEKILLEIGVSHKRAELARYKQDNSKNYSYYSDKGKYSDFHVILAFVKNDIEEFIGQDMDVYEEMKKALNELGLEKYAIFARLVQLSDEALTYENVMKKSQDRKDLIEILENSKKKPAKKRKKKTTTKPKKEEVKQEETEVKEISADDLPW